MTLLALYLGCLVLGGILVGASMMGGGADHGADADAGGGDHGGLDHGDVDHGGGDHGGGDHGALEHAGPDHAAGPASGTHDLAHRPDADLLRPGADAAGVLATFLSIRFWTFFAASFGLTGTALTLVGAPAVASLPLALVTGTVVGGGVSAALRRLAQDTVSTETSTRLLAGREAEVVLSVGPAKPGKIRVTHNGQIVDLPATTREDRLLERGERVLIVEVHGGEADVTPVAPGRHPPPTPLPT